MNSQIFSAEEIFKTSPDTAGSQSGPRCRTLGQKCPPVDRVADGVPSGPRPHLHSPPCSPHCSPPVEPEMQSCIAMVIINIALIHLTLLASYVVLVEVRSVIVIVEVTYGCTPESESSVRSRCNALKLTCHSSRGKRIIRITIVPIHL